MRARRALLYMPGVDWRKIQKATTLDVDSVCMDLEDGVALSRKAEARETVARALQSLDFGRSEKLFRINPVGSGLEADDLAAVLPARPDGVVVPKVTDGDQLRWVSEQIQRLERDRGWPPGEIRLLAVVETALGILNLREIAAVGAPLEALIFGAEDLAGDVGAVRTPEGSEIFYARSAVVLHAAAFGLAALDMVSLDFRDLQALEEEARLGAQMGFLGKQVIHPDQVPVVQKAFTPAPEEIARARRIVQAFEEHLEQGTGAFALDGKMVDMPVVKAARAVLARAQAAGVD